MFQSFVAGGIVAITVGSLCIVPFLISNKKHRKIIFVIVTFVFIIILITIFFFGSQIGGFIEEASELMHGNWDDSFGSGRLYIWRKSIQLVPQRPLFGGGPDTFGLRTDANFQRLDKNTGILIRSDVDVAHNEYLNILVNQGALALLFYLAAVFCAIKSWIRNNSSKPASTICGGAVICYLIQAFFGINSPISAPFFWICLAVIIGEDRFDKKSKEE